MRTPRTRDDAARWRSSCGFGAVRLDVAEDDERVREAVLLGDGVQPDRLLDRVRSGVGRLDMDALDDVRAVELLEEPPRRADGRADHLVVAEQRVVAGPARVGQPVVVEPVELPQVMVGLDERDAAIDLGHGTPPSPGWMTGTAASLIGRRRTRSTRLDIRARQADSHPVDGHGAEEQQATRDLDPERRDVQLDEAVGEDADDEHGEDRPADAAPPARQAGATEDDRRDDRQLDAETAVDRCAADLRQRGSGRPARRTATTAGTR